MVKYIKIVNYMSGDSINKQIQNIIDNGMMDEDTTMWYLYQKNISLKDLLKMAKVLNIKSIDK